MAIEIRCPGCSRTLRVPDEHGGKQVRCPACQQISVAPAAGGGEPVKMSADSDQATWHLRTPDGPTYGPLAWPQVQAWAGEGRITAGCQLADDADGHWRPATDFFPQLQRTTAAPAAPQAPQTYPWSAQQIAEITGVSRGYVNPHRGGLIFVLGLLGFMSCPIFSLLAWVMGSHDLGEMRAGRMDRSGEGLTQAGQILGMIVSVLLLVACGLALFIFLFAALVASF